MTGDVRTQRLAGELCEAARLADPTERLLESAAVIADALSDIGVSPVIVGGLAVAYWLESKYSTVDIDVLMPTSPDVDARLQAIGLERHGRSWLVPDTPVAFEAPGWSLERGAQAELVELRSGRTLRVLRAEDVLIDRLHQFHAGGHRDVFEQAVALSLLRLDWEAVRRRASAEGLTHVMEAILDLGRRVMAGERFEAWELHDIARTLRRA